MTTYTQDEAGADEIKSLHILTLNCWGLKYLSKHRQQRLSEIGNRLAAHQPALDIVGLQECWTFSDYTAIRETTRQHLPYGKFYHSGIFGGGLVVLSRFPIVDSSMFRYPLNGRPTAFFRGDWFVGKGVACTTLELPNKQHIEVFNTHLHAPYEKEPNDSYICHRTAQAWEIAKLMKAAQERGNLVIGLGDFNMVPMSFAHVLIENRGHVRDVWRELYPASSIGASVDVPEADRRKRMMLPSTPDAKESLSEHGHTCDSILNTWRWNKAHQKKLEQGHDRQISSEEPDPRAKRLDYIFFGGLDRGWKVDSVKVALTERHPKLRCSLSDHFAVETTIVSDPSLSREPLKIVAKDVLAHSSTETASEDVVEMDQEDLTKFTSRTQTQTVISTDFYERILSMIDTYTLRERKQRRWRLGHFIGAALFSIGSFVAVWWSKYTFVAFILLLCSTFGILAGTLDGLIGGLFVGSELRALNEFEWEVRNALHRAGGPRPEERPLSDWAETSATNEQMQPRVTLHRRICWKTPERLTSYVNASWSSDDEVDGVEEIKPKRRSEQINDADPSGTSARGSQRLKNQSHVQSINATMCAAAMASTRASTGNSKPRVVPTISTTPERKRKTTTTRKPATKKVTTKKSTTGAGITKKRAPNTHHKRKASLKDKVEGALEKAEGTITRKPGKKAAGTKKIRGTDGKNSRTAKK